MKKYSIGFIGGGRITRIFLEGFNKRKVKFDSVKVFEPNKDVAKTLSEKFHQIQLCSSEGEVASQEIVFLAVHPPMMAESMQNLKDLLDVASIVVSLAPKFAIEKIAASLSVNKIVRMIPNATSIINEGFNPVVFSQGVEEKEKEQLLKLFKQLGKTFETDESKLEGYAILSAMLPTYFWFQWNALEDIASKTGLSENEAKNAIKSTLKRAIKLYFDPELSRKEVMDLIPVKPIGEHEEEIKNIFETKLMGLFEKIKS